MDFTSIVGLLTIVFVVILAKKKQMEWIALLFSMQSIVFGIGLSLALFDPEIYDPQNNLAGSIFYLSSSFIACFLITLASTESHITSNTSHEPLEKIPKNRWFLLGLGISTTLIALIGFFILILGIKPPKPYIASMFFVLLSLISIFLLYGASDFRLLRRPNLIKIIVIVFSAFSTYLGVQLAAVLLYAVPVEPKVAKAYAASIVFFGTVAYTCLLIKVTSISILTKKVIPIKLGL